MSPAAADPAPVPTIKLTVSSAYTWTGQVVTLKIVSNAPTNLFISQERAIRETPDAEQYSYVSATLDGGPQFGYTESAARLTRLF